MRRALIGHTGFVGANLDRAGGFTHRYNSRNFRDMAGERFDEIVCAGIQAVKWWANRNPAEDRAAIAALLRVLAETRADRFVLISTVDVYRDPAEVDEDSPTLRDGLSPYGLHRLEVEEWVTARFADRLILRLPGLYGPGLKKNLVHDILSGAPLTGFDDRAAFQFYGLGRLAADMDSASAARLRLVNLAVEPVTTGDVVARLTGLPFHNRLAGDPPRYAMRTCHAGALRGRQGPWLETAEDSLAGLAAFAAEVRAAAAAPGRDLRGEARA
jgi:hypothetical protein